MTIHALISSIVEHFAIASPEIAEQFQKRKSMLLIILILWQVGFTLIAFIACIFMTHRVAGPLFKLQKYLSGIRDGQFSGKLIFRKGDYFHEVAEDINDTFKTIQENYKNDFVYLSEVNTYLNNLAIVVPDDKKIVLKEITEKLTEIQNRFRQLEK
jgi:signal transduction histidine kinase